MSSFIALPYSGGDPRQVAFVVNNILEGKLNSIGSIQLSNNVTSTIVNDKRVGNDSIILFMPTNSFASNELASGSMFVSSTQKQVFTITHLNNANTRTFKYIVLG
tara:strand:+ start:1084 stop:1398 length:315 start_codon:yes stop_codon:yes gene_type:complete